jgi:hypothetical protein
MTTFTRIAEGETPSISVDVERRLSKIGRKPHCRARWDMITDISLDPMIYGGFMEYVHSFNSSSSILENTVQRVYCFTCPALFIMASWMRESRGLHLVV